MLNTKTIEKIDKQRESLQKKIDALSGNYLTNTRKRQEEQKHRDNMKEQHRQRLELLSYLKNEAAARELTGFENALITGAFYDRVCIFSRQREYYKNNPHYKVSSLQLSNTDQSFQKTMTAIGINDDEGLHSTLDLFDDILKNAVIPTDPQAIRLRDLTFRARLHQSGDVQFTPEALAKRVIAHANITAGSKVLEPEAGIGSIADEVKTVTPDVDCIEIYSDFREILEIKGHNLIADDLFDCEQQPIYDAVLMNPPFSKEIEHIKYAFGFAKPGGVLVAVCSNRFKFIENRGYPEFRQWLNEQDGFCHEDAGEKFEMTGTNSVILTIKKGA